MARLIALLVLLVVLAGCGGATTPCDDSDPTGICANSHSQTHDAV